jgi:hypothetical protein
LPPDIAIDARKTSVEEAQKEIAKLRPDDYIGWPGVDGKSAFFTHSIKTYR